MTQQFIHEDSWLSGPGCKVRNASVEVPRTPPIAENFEHAVAEDQETRAGRDMTRLSWKIHSAQHTHHQT